MSGQDNGTVHRLRRLDLEMISVLFLQRRTVYMAFDSKCTYVQRIKLVLSAVMHSRVLLLRWLGGGFGESRARKAEAEIQKRSPRTNQ